MTLDRMTTLQRLLHHPILPRDEQVELCRRAQAGDRAARRAQALVAAGVLTEAEARVAAGRRAAARDRLALASALLVMKEARRLEGPGRARGLDLDDLASVGFVGLLRAIDRFDADRGLAFATYATLVVRRNIRNALAPRAGEPIAIPALGSDPGLAAEAEAARAAGPADAAPAEAEQAAADRAEMLRRVAGLPPRQRAVVTLRYGLDGGGRRTFRQIGELLGCSRANAGAIDARAVERLRGDGPDEAAPRGYSPNADRVGAEPGGPPVALTRAERMVLSAARDLAARGRLARPITLTEFAGAAGVCSSTARQVVPRLRSLGLIDLELSDGRGRWARRDRAGADEGEAA